jgi:CHAT domain-containing protein
MGRVVLLPVGELGLVPWHAVFRSVDGVDRFLVQDRTVSFAPSARLFCDVMARLAVASGAAVLVGNPARDLPAGIAEATAVRDAFYPKGIVLGSLTASPRPHRPAEGGAGTPEQVLDALRTPIPLLHLACHAVADMRDPLKSSVMLSGTALSARELLDVDRTNALPVDVVTLAGCTTNAVGTDYDEALSLSTTLLAIGARTVIGSLWRVPAGQTTTQLMFVYYHYVQSGYSRADALRGAQCWMLDPGRQYPDTMPAYIRDMPPAAGLDHVDIECWAGFTQQGR